MAFAAPLAQRRVIDRLVKTEAAFRPGGGQPLQIQAGRFRRHHQRHRRSIGRHHPILAEAAFQPQAGHAEGAVLIVELRVDRVVAGFRNAPGQAELLAVFDLPRHRRARGLVEQGVVVGRHHQLRHQVLEHRAAPGQQNRLAAGAGEQTSEREPALLRQLPLRDGDEHGETRFRRQQVVEAAVAPPLVDAVANAQLSRRLVVQETIFHVGHLAGLHGQALDVGDARLGMRAG